MEWSSLHMSNVQRLCSSIFSSGEIETDQISQLKEQKDSAKDIYMGQIFSD